MPDVFVNQEEQPLRDSRMGAPESLPPLIKKVKRTKPASSLFSGFAEHPNHVRFQNQEPDEEILLFLRKSSIVNIPWIFFACILILIPPLFFFLHPPITFLTIPLTFIIIGTLFYYLLIFTYVFVNFVTWYYNVAFITNKRLVDVDFHQLVFKDVAETKLELVQDVSYRQVGVIENLFNFGHVLIQTAGTIDNFEFNALPNPERVVEVVEELIGKKPNYGV